MEKWEDTNNQVSFYKEIDILYFMLFLFALEAYGLFLLFPIRWLCRCLHLCPLVD